MKILLDANLSYRLVKNLSGMYPDCLHVTRTGLSMPAEDIDIWNWAKQNNYLLVVTNDEDFKHLLSRFGFPPKIVLLRTGNQSTQFIAEVLKKHFTDLVELESSNEMGLLEIF
jgi:predicted nuclease of predicted toxin-antitoxin system